MQTNCGFLRASLVALILLTTLPATSGTQDASVVGASMTGGRGGPQGPLRKIVFTHRHCARTEISDIGNGCGGVGCGMCTTQGELMLKATGESFRERYGSVLPTEYHMDKYTSVSDEYPRTQQSASAFIKGLFAFNHTSSMEIAPAINTGGQHIIDPWKGTPTYELRNRYNAQSGTAASSPNISHYVSKSAIDQMWLSLGMNSTSTCDGYGTECLDRILDFAFSAAAEGTLINHPVLYAHWTQLQAVENYLKPFWNVGWEHFVNKDGFYTKAGYPGHPIFDAMLVAAGSEDSTVLTEFSGHDNTIQPLYAAMGNWTFVYPQFATSVVFEVYTNPTEASNPFIVVKTALPDQLPGTHPLTWFEYDLTCMNATSGQTYTTTTGCPLRDLAAFAATRRGTETGAMGGCYAFPGDLLRENCTDKSGVTPTNKECVAYRQSCPLVACGVGYYMKPDYSCNPV